MKKWLDVSLLKQYFWLTRKQRWSTIRYSLTLVGLSVTQVIIPLVTAEVLDRLTAGTMDKFAIALIAVAVLWLIDQIFYYLACTSYSVFLRDCFIDMNQQIVQRIYNFSADELVKIPRGKITSMSVSDAFDIAEMMEYITDLPFNSVMSIVMTVILGIVDWRFGVLVGVTTVAYFLLANFLTKRAAKYYEEQRRATDKLVSLLGQTMDGIREIKTYNLGENLDKKYEALYQQFGARYMLRRKYHVNYEVNLRYIMYAVRVVIYMWAAGLFAAGEISVGAVVMIVNYAGTIFENSYITMRSLNELRRGKVALKRIWGFLHVGGGAKRGGGDGANDDGQNDTDQIVGRVRFKNVNFNYAALPTLRRVSFVAEPGQLTAIVGKTGSGKTTIFNLLLRLYAANAGEILIDEIPIENFSEEVFYKNVTAVNQEGFLFDMSIRENLSLVNPSEVAQIEACQRVGIHDVIMELPRGYATRLVGDGANLSGGQRRLLALAKALLSGAEVLLFDEVTSSLDPATTKEIGKVLKDLARDHTVIMITHKRELMRMADKLIVLKKGRVAVRGSYAEVAGEM